ncbi:MAG: hypothetical protein K9G46_14695 [Flavobacteriales bacterium]|nr:hypothetical protein [Flavobacteriales bacterium]
MDNTEQHQRVFQLRALHQELKKLEAMLSVAWYSRPFKYWFGSSGIEAQLEKGRKKRFQLIEIHLQQTNDAYLKLVKANLQLLSSDKAYFKVTTNTYGFISSYATRFSGNLLDNGYAYCRSVEGNNPLLPMADFSFPSRLTGIINHWGAIQLSATSTDLAFIKTLPTAYEGRIGVNGRIDIRVKATETDILAGGKKMIDKLMANIFGADGQKAAQFADNKAKMRSIIHDFEEGALS